jgi:uncharacterized protein
MDSTDAPTISVIVPCWNDAVALREVLASFSKLHGLREIIVADASDTSECRDIAASFGARAIVCVEPSRGRQMNDGAATATSDVFLFHHADSVLTQAHVDSLANAMRANGAVGGAFHRKFDARHPAFRWLEPIARRMAERGGTLYGDQSVFVRCAHFQKLAGFANMPLMEDVEFSKRLRSSGRVVVLDPPMESSARRHLRYGALKMSILNGAMILAYRLGVSPRLLHRWYYKWKP